MSHPSANNPSSFLLTMHRYATIILTTALATTLAGSFVSCSKKALPAEPEPRAVITYVVDEPKLEVTRKFSGVSQASDSAELGFEIAGRIIELPAVSGTRYAKGTILAKLDTTSLEAQLRQAQAEATRATEELKRVQQLFETGNSSKAQLDQAIAGQKTSAAALESATRSVTNGVLRMPYDGVIGEVLKEKQEVVSGGTPVIRVQGEGSMEIKIGITAEYINTIKVGMKAKVYFPNISKEPLAATIKKVSPQASENTTYPVTLSIDENNEKLRDGLDGEAALPLPNPNGASIRVPISCIVGAAGNQRYVFIIKKTSGQLGVVEKRSVKVGALAENATVEILDGLTAGEIILARGVHRIEAGTEVRISE